MFQTIYSVAGLTALCALILVALWRGGATEQTASGIYGVAWISTLIAEYALAQPVVWVAVIDAATLASFGILAWRSQRDWVMIAMAFQGASFAMNLLYLFDSTIDRTLYVSALAIATLGVLGSIAYGVCTNALQRNAPRET